jgi:hypothetical protein
MATNKAMAYRSALFVFIPLNTYSKYKVAILVIEVYRIVPNEMWHLRGMTEGWDVLPEVNKSATLKKMLDYKP